MSCIICSPLDSIHGGKKKMLEIRSPMIICFQVSIYLYIIVEVLSNIGFIKLSYLEIISNFDYKQLTFVFFFQVIFGLERLKVVLGCHM